MSEMFWYTAVCFQSYVLFWMKCFLPPLTCRHNICPSFPLTPKWCTSSGSSLVLRENSLSISERIFTLFLVHRGCWDLVVLEMFALTDTVTHTNIAHLFFQWLFKWVQSSWISCLLSSEALGCFSSTHQQNLLESVFCSFAVWSVFLHLR